MENTNEKKSLQEKYFKLANKKFLNESKMGDRQFFMSHDIFTLNIFDEEVKKQILNNSKEKISANKLNKMVILLKYFLRTGISNYHFKNNDFTKKFVYSDNRTINGCLDILKEANLIEYNMYINKNNPKIRGYFINPKKALQFAISLKDENVFTRNTKANEEFENCFSSLDNDEDSFEDNPSEYLKNEENQISTLVIECMNRREELQDLINKHEDSCTILGAKFKIQMADKNLSQKTIEHLKHQIDYCDNDDIKQKLQEKLLEEEKNLVEIQNTSFEDYSYD